MLQAQLSGKLTRHEQDLEDLLTSNVFGSIKYVPIELGLIPLLSSAENHEGRIFSQPGIDSILEVRYEFWPLLHEVGCAACEPDLLIRITHINGKRSLILVESKYLSGKSSEADEMDTPSDQLAREWSNLVSLAKRCNANPIMLYVTAGTVFPTSDVEAARLELGSKCPEKSEMNIFWLSWRSLPKIFSNTDQEILKDLVTLLRRQGLKMFEGISRCDPIDYDWSFKAAPLFLDWSSIKVNNISWKLEPEQKFIWSHGISFNSANWRYS